MEAAMEGELFSKQDILASMSDMINTLHKMDGKVKKIYDVVVGNEEFDQQGLLSRVKKLEGFQNKMEALKNKIIGASIGGGILFTALWEFLKYLLSTKK